MKEVKSLVELTEILEHNDKVIVDFWAVWCAPCKMFAPVFEGLSNERTDIMFVKANVGEIAEFTEAFSITSVPTLIYFKAGEEVKREKAYQKSAVVKSIIEVF